MRTDAVVEGKGARQQTRCFLLQLACPSLFEKSLDSVLDAVGKVFAPVAPISAFSYF